MNIFNQTIDPFCVLSIGKEPHKIPLFCQQGQILMDIL